VPAVFAATPNHVPPAQRIDAKVLLISADGTEPGFGAWKAELAREGVPYDTFVSYSGPTKVATLSDSTLADYAGNHAKYDAIILSTGDLGHNVTNPGGTTSFLSAFTDAEWTALAKFERTFGIRQLSDYTAPSLAHGLNTVGGATQDGNVGTLTAAGKAAFPYLKGPIPIANDDPTVAESFGYQATPLPGVDWQTLVAGPSSTAYLGIYTHSDGIEEMVSTVASNENQSQAQLLRHGELNWVTRGVFLGYQRNYLELQVDDLFLGDDAWDPATHTTSFDPTKASRMTPADVAQAVAWSKAHAIRLDFAFNGGGSEQFKADNNVATDPLAAAFADPATRSQFGFINHTYDHPNLDCSTASFITKEITDNVTWGRQLGLSLDPTEVITGEHSGLANTRPGNPGTIDPPTFDDVTPGGTGGTIPAGTYDYALTATSPAGETIASVVPGIAVTAGQTVTATFNSICHATSFKLYRAPTGTTTWTLAATLAHTPTTATDNGTAPIVLSITDSGAGAAGTPPAANGAALAPYGQNPNYLAGIAGAGVDNVATDASKGYPTIPTDITSAQYPPGQSFAEGNGSAGFTTVPRYPSNVYYNVSKQSQQLDEYNWIYLAPANGGGCVPIAGVTTCRTTPATWSDYVTSENNIMFRHLTGNDPRPDFMHQSNLADYNPALPETDPNQGGILYAVIGPLLARYESQFDRASTPLIQLTPTQIAATLNQQDAWAANVAAGRVSAWIEDGQLHVRNNSGSSIDVPLTGTTVGDMYAGQRTGWVTLPGGAERVFSPNDPANVNAPAVSGTAKVGSTLTASNGSWSGTAPIDLGYQWQRCSSDTSCTNIAGATGASYQPVAADGGRGLRVVVMAGNWISSVSQAASSITRDVPRVSGAAGSKSRKASSKSAKVSLTKVKMSPRRFAVEHRKKRRGTRLDGSRITWKLNQAATVKLVFQRRTGSAKHRRWVRVGSMSRKAKKGNGVVRFTGRFGKKLLKPRQYRLVAMASTRSGKSAHKHVTFRVVKG
jgi:hypothetical protein